MEELYLITNLLVAWSPFIAFIAIALWHVRQMRKCLMTQDGRSLATVLDELVREVKRVNDAKTPTI